MLALVLMGFGSFFEEVTLSLNKVIMTRRIETLSVLGFLQSVITLIMYLIYGWLTPGGLVLSWSAWSTLSLRTLLEVVIAYCTMQAVAKAERGAYGFIRTFTVPLLLITDIVLGYHVSLYQQIGILIVFFSVLFLTAKRGFGHQGIRWVIATALIAVATTSLYKYDLKFNSAAAEQSVIYGIEAAFFLILILRTKESVLTLLRQKGLPLALIAQCFGSLLQGLSYQYAAASWVIAVKRALGVFWAMLSGRMVFEERKFGLKLIAFGGCVVGLLLMVLG